MFLLLSLDQIPLCQLEFQLREYTGGRLIDTGQLLFPITSTSNHVPVILDTMPLKVPSC